MRILTISGRQLLALVIGTPLLMVAIAVTQVSLAEDVAANEDRVSVSRQGSVFARDHGMRVGMIEVVDMVAKLGTARDDGEQAQALVRKD